MTDPAASDRTHASALGDAGALAALSGAPLALALVDPAAPHRVRWANAAFASAVGGPGRDVVGRVLTDLVGATVGLGDALANAPEEHDVVLLDSRNVARGVQRHWEVTISRARAGTDGDALLVVLRDVTAREESRRRMEAENRRLVTLVRVGQYATSLDPGAVAGAAARAASALCEGPAAVYLRSTDGALVRAGSAAVTPELAAVLTPVLAPDGLAILRSAMDLQEMRSCILAPGIPGDERTLLREAGARWLAATPVRGHTGALGGIVTLWRKRTISDGAPALAHVARQLAFALEHAQSYAAAEAERARLALILADLPDGVWIGDMHGAITDMNASGRRLLGLQPGDPLPTVGELSARLEWWDGDRRIHDDTRLVRVLRGDRISGVLCSVAKPGCVERVMLLASAIRMRDKDAGRPIGIIGVVTDVTERRRAEERLRFLAGASAALAASLDVESTLEAVARLAVPLLGDWSVVDVVGRSGLRRLRVACADPGGKATAAALERLAPGAPLPPDARATLYADARSAPLVTAAVDDPALGAVASCITAPIVARGETFGFIHFGAGAARAAYVPADVTLADEVARRAAAAMDTARLYEEARAADRRKDEFLAVLSHELRTPLAPMLTWVEILRRKRDTADVARAADVIERNVRLQRALIDELLDLAAITRGKVVLDRRRTDLVAVLRAATDTVATQAADKSIRLTALLPDEQVPIDADERRLQQVFANLLVNAVKFTPTGGTVTAEVRRSDARCEVSIRDTGEGIAPEFLPHVFDMFRQGEEGSRRSHGGLGIGLALAAQIVHLHGGDIRAASAGRGCGAEFVVRLPLAVRRGLVRAAPGARPRDGASLGDVTILVVEDVADSREADQLLLEQLGARVLLATHGGEALDRLATDQADVVLCDIRMPVMDGFEFVRRVRADPGRAAMPIVAVSGFASDDARRRSREAGFDAYVTKPFEPDTLVACVRAAIAARRRAAGDAA